MTPLHSNHNHTHPHSSSAHGSFFNHNLSTITSANISIRLTMPPTPPPPIDPLSPSNNGVEALNSVNTCGRDANGTPTASAKPGTGPAAKVGAPSFASVVSSSTGHMAKPPLPKSSATPTPQKQQQKQVQSASANPEAHSLALGTSGDDYIASAQTTMDAALSAANTTPASPASDYVDAQEGEEGDRDNDNDHEDSESSDVEIYLNTLALHDSAARMHVLSGAGGGESTNANASRNPTPPRLQPPRESPTRDLQPGFGLGAIKASNSTDATSIKSLSPLPLPMPLSSSPTHHLSQQQHQFNQQPNQNLPPTNVPGIAAAKSPKIPPPAPVHGTIPLPDVDECDHGSNNNGRNGMESGSTLDADQRQLQQLQMHQQLHGHGLGVGTQSASDPPHQQQLPSIDQTLQNATIELTNLSVGGGDPLSPSVPAQGRKQFGIPTSQSQPFPDSNHNNDFVHDYSPNPTADNNNAPFHTSVSESALGGGGGPASAGHGMGTGVDQSQKTPNVYINGLPPHYPEDELFNLASEFGPIRSVRTFTRHVRDSESGYGFVLFEHVDDAEKCIIALRRFRNLHPTFSKQIHKIPGTSYAQANTPSSISSPSVWDDPNGSSSSSADDTYGGDASFKAKMESLHDPTSTNLYMEGLPLSIDEPTLSALVSPHRISSSRFFQTRLSNPPRIIAFVRLETRIGAEEIIERLHGRMVRGWNDTGSRISVRFADTSEQRELRRTERATQEGDGSPARLTIAQAALLNLRGQDLRSTKTGPVIHAHSHAGSRIPSSSSNRGGAGFSTSISAPDFSSNAHAGLSNIPVIGSGSGGGSSGLEVDYSLAPGRAVGAGLGVGMGMGMDPRARSPYRPQGYGHQDQYTSQLGVGQGHGQLSPNTNLADPNMAALLDSLRATGVPYRGSGGDVGYGDGMCDGMGEEYGMQNQRMLGHQHQYQQGFQGQHHHNHPLQMSQSLDNLQQYARPSPAYTRSGYTATEEYIMRTHVENAALARAQAEVQLQQQQLGAERRRPAPLDLRRRRMEEGGDESVGGANIAVGVRGYRAQASLMSPLTTSNSMGSIGSAMGSMGSSSVVGAGGIRMGGGMGNEDAFHASPASASASVMGDFRLGEGDRTSATSMHASSRGHTVSAARLLREPGSAPASTSATSYQALQRPMPLSPLIPMSASHSNQEGAVTSPNPNEMLAYQHQNVSAAHLRSSTLPQQRSSSVRDREREVQQQQQQQAGAIRGHHQHNSMSMPAQNFRTPQHASVAKLGGVGMEGGQGGTIYEHEVQEDRQHQQRDGSGNGGGIVNHTNGNGNGNGQPTNSTGVGPAKTHYSSSAIFGDMEQSSPISASSSLISPTLTYSSHTPSTLSPATPFFGSFNSQTDGFEKSGGGEQNQQQNQKAVVVGAAAIGPVGSGLRG